MAERNKPNDPRPEAETTGHEWDGIRELDHPSPRWWLLVFYACCLFSVGYWVVYPAWPTLSGHTRGVWGWNAYDKLKREQASIAERQTAYLERFKAASFSDVMKDPELYAFAVAGGKAAFKDNCATCHGTGGAGGPGYPNLNDDDWLWGGTIEEIYQTIRYGIRSPHPDTRTSQMPSFGRDQVLSGEEVGEVVDYVRSLSGLGKADADGKGAKIFADNCAACHGADGKGGREFGAPNLTDAIWLYGGDRDAVYQTVFYAHAGVMPTWENRLDPQTIRQLSVYVHSLGGGESGKEDTPAPAAEPLPSKQDPETVAPSGQP